MHTKVWTFGGLAAGCLLAAGGWVVAAGRGEVTTSMICAADLSTDTGVAAAARGIALVEGVRNGPYQEDESTQPGAFLTTEVKVLNVVKGRFPAVLSLTQGVKGGGSPGRYATEDPDRYAVLEPGKRYVIAVRFGSTMGEPGTEAWVSHAEPLRRGIDGEISHWRTAVADSPKAATPAECNDVFSPG
ncbi:MULTISPECIES: hypothetical protein [unclassified Streptomyces]|uniref:hypothetical protein n=1 Tax=unclassified Streptomyces TaxID=2593676 RepID=UPI00381889F1